MAVLITVENHGQTLQGYEGMREILTDDLKHAPGFVLHTSHAVEDGWRVYEIWKSIEAANAFFAAKIAPNLPKGVRPKRSVTELHDFVVAQEFATNADMGSV